VKHRIIVKM